VGNNAHWVATSTVLAGVLILELARSQGALTSFLSSKTLLLLGGASYALYLLQGPIRALCDMLVMHPFDRFVSPVVTIAAAIAAFLIVEQPARTYLWHLYRKRKLQASMHI
jgi:peptidoglycan/LPS O-acetylase OafA/YrhL